MTEKRTYPRYESKLKCTFEYYEGDPEAIDMELEYPEQGKGYIMDISRGGVFIISDERVAVSMPVRLSFSIGKSKFTPMGVIVRTGLLENNPSEIARRFSRYSAKGQTYIAVEFNDPLEEFDSGKL